MPYENFSFNSKFITSPQYSSKADTIQYPIEDTLLYENLQLHEISIPQNVPYDISWIDTTVLGDVLEVWDFCALYKDALLMKSYPFEQFYASIISPNRNTLIESIILAYTKAFIITISDDNDNAYIGEPIFIALKAKDEINEYWPAIVYLVLKVKEFYKFLTPLQVSELENIRTLTNTTFYQMPYQNKLGILVLLTRCMWNVKFTRDYIEQDKKEKKQKLIESKQLTKELY